MYRLIVENTEGKQQIINIELTGSYYDPTKVFWDERTQGVIPNNILNGVGGLVFNQGQLEVDPNLLSQAQAASAAQLAEEQNQAMLIQQARQILRNVDNISSLAEAKAALKALVRLVAKELLQ